MRFWAAKYVSTVHPPAGQFPTGVPRVEVSMVDALDETEEGTDARGKNQILGEKQSSEPETDKGLATERTHEIPLSANSVTHTPPPALAKPAP